MFILAWHSRVHNWEEIGEEVEGRAGEGGGRGVTCPSFQYKLSNKY